MTVPTFSTYPEDICTALDETSKTQTKKWPHFPVAILNRSTLSLELVQSPSCFSWSYFQTPMVYRGKAPGRMFPESLSLFACSVHQDQVLPGAPSGEGALGGPEMGKRVQGSPAELFLQSCGGSRNTCWAPGTRVDFSVCLLSPGRPFSET